MLLESVQMPSQRTSKHLRKEMNQTADKSDVSNQHLMTVETEVTAAYSGPLPDPSMLLRYKDAGDNFPERIMQMAEAHNKADVNTKNRISFSNLTVPIIGQVFTLFLGSAGIIACVYLASSGFTGEAITSVLTSFSPIIINAFRGLRPQNKNGK